MKRKDMFHTCTPMQPIYALNTHRHYTKRLCFFYRFHEGWVYEANICKHKNRRAILCPSSTYFMSRKNKSHSRNNANNDTAIFEVC